MRNALLIALSVTVLPTAHAGPPDDWQMAPVGPDGGRQYDPRGPASFAVRLIPSVAGGITDRVSQESRLPQEAYVRTVCKRHELECVTEAFAVAAAAGPQSALPERLAVERIGSPTVLIAWAAPSQPCDPAFADIAVGWNEPITYRIRADRSVRYTVVFGLCEGHHTRGGQRPLELQIEDRTRKTVDPVAERGRNVPLAYAEPGADENGDGWIEARVAPVAGAPDTNAILNALWIFPVDQTPPLAEVVAGRHDAAALAYLPCGSGVPPTPRDDVLILRLHSPPALDITTVPTLTLETGQPVQVDPDHKWARIGAWTTVSCAQAFVRVEHYPGRTVLVYHDTKIPAGGQQALVFAVHRGPGAGLVPSTLQAAEALRAGQ